MANKEHRCGSSKDAPREPDADDLALPGEEMENDENLRLEVNIDREAWNRWLVWSPSGSVLFFRIHAAAKSRKLHDSPRCNSESVS